MQVHGACHCGSIRYSAEVDPQRVVICHCSDCQVLSGSAFRTVAFTVEGTLGVEAGTPRVYVKTADSGNRREQAFCGECGSPLWATSVGDGPKVHGLRVGTLAERDRLAPRRQVWLRSALAWVTGIGRLPGVDGQP